MIGAITTPKRVAIASRWWTSKLFTRKTRPIDEPRPTVSCSMTSTSGTADCGLLATVRPPSASGIAAVSSADKASGSITEGTSASVRGESSGETADCGSGTISVLPHSGHSLSIPTQSGSASRCCPQCGQANLNVGFWFSIVHPMVYIIVQKVVCRTRCRNSPLLKILSRISGKRLVLPSSYRILDETSQMEEPALNRTDILLCP